MNRKNTKKLLSVILSLVMVLSYLPASSFAFAVDGEAGPVVEADSNAGNDTTVNTDTGADTDTNTTDGSDQVTEGDKEDPPAVDDKKDEQAEPKEEGKKVEANTEAKEPAKGSEDEEGDEEPAGGEKDAGMTYSANLADFLAAGLMEVELKHEDGTDITELEPLRTGEMATLKLTVYEEAGGLQFDMDSLTYQLPAGFDIPSEVTGTNNANVSGYHGESYQLHNDYTISTGRLLTYIWDQSDTDVYELACDAENMTFTLSRSIKISEDVNEIVFNNDIKYPVDNTGTLTVTKSVTGVDSLTEAQMKAMTFRVIDKATGQVPKDKDGVEREDCTFSLFEMSGNDLTNKTYEILKLPPGEYTVEEVGHPTIDAYTFMESSSILTEDATVHGGKKVTANLSNVYAQDFGNLKIKKLFDEDSALNDSNLGDKKADIEFKVVGPNGPVTGSPFKYSDFTNGELNLRDLPIGTYTVTETDNFEGYTRETTYQLNTDPSAEGNEAQVAIAKNDNDVLTYTNKYTEKKGHLKIKKTFSGTGAVRIPADQKKNVTFRVTGPNGYDQTFKYDAFDADGVLDLGEVLTGTYIITESNANFPDYSVTRTTTITDADSSSGLVATSVVEEGQTDFPKFDNKYEPVGKLTITKKVAGVAYNNSTVTAGTKYTVQKKVNGVWTNFLGPIALNNKNYFKYVNGLWTWTLTNLEPGEYRVVETKKELTDYTLAYTVSVDGGAKVESLTAETKVEWNENSTVAYENTYTRNKGYIKINKKIIIDGEEIDPNTLTDEQKADMKFTIKSGNTTKTFTLAQILAGDDTYEVNTSSSTTWTITESGADLKVKVVDPDDPNNVIYTQPYMRDSSATLDGAAQNMTVTTKVTENGKTYNVEYTNNYVSSGFLMLKKDVYGLNATDAATVKNQLRFKIFDKTANDYIRDANGDIKLYTLAQLTTSPGVKLSADHVYTVEEVDYEFKPDEYDVTVKSSLIEGEFGFGGVVSPDIEIDYNYTSLVYYENTYTKWPGPGVTVIKHVRLNGQIIEEGITDQMLAAFDALVKGLIRFKIESTDGTYSEIFTYDQLKNGNTDIPPGTYTITELDYLHQPELEGYLCTVYFEINGQKIDGDHATFTLTHGNAISMDVWNGYQEVGKLTVKKSFHRDSAIQKDNIPDPTAITFTVTGYRNSYKNEIIFGPKTFNYTALDANGEKVFDDIPAGYYEVSESAEIPKYTLVSADWDHGVDYTFVRKGGEEIKEVTNRYERQKGNLRVTKTLDLEKPLDTSRSDLPHVTFNVKNKDNNTPEFNAIFTYAEMTSVDSDGNHYKEFNVPTGEYVVTETNADFGYYIRTSTVKVGSGNSEPYDEENGATGEVTYNQTTNIEITNKYEEAGHLIFKKSFKDDACINKLTAAQKRKIKFTVFEGTKKYDEFTYADFDSATDSYTLLVRPETEYIVYESMAEITGYNRVTTVKVGDGPDAAYNDDTGASAQVAVFTDKEVKFTNTYEERGKLQVTKTVANITQALTEEQKKAIRFEVYGPDGQILKDETGAEIGKFSLFEISTGDFTGSKTFNNLPAGDYVVKEFVDDSKFYGCNRTTTVKVGSGAPTPYNEENGASAQVTKNGQKVEFTNSYDDADRLSVVKSDGGFPHGAGIITIDGHNYPYWKFTLTINNLKPETTDNGATDLRDIYDDKLQGLFRVLTKDEAEAANIDGAANANTLVPIGGGTAATVTLTQDDDANQAVFHISNVTDETATSNTLTYYLVPRDTDAVGRLNTSGEGSGDVSTDSSTIEKHFLNTVYYRPLPKLDEVSDAVPYQYITSNISKKCINYDATTKTFFDPDNPGVTVTYAVYEVILNKDGVKIGDKDYLDVEDTVSDNQSVDFLNIEWYRYHQGEGDSYTTEPVKDGDIKDAHMDGYTLYFKMKNELPILMRYKSRIGISSDDVGTTMVIQNTVKLEGKEVTVKPEIVPDGTGGGSVAMITIAKTHNEDMNKRLAGAQFELYRDVNSSGSEEGMQRLYNPDKTDGDPDDPAEGRFTTDKNGLIEIRNYLDADGNEHHIAASKRKPITYFLKEAVAPIGYKPLTYVIHVRVADTSAGESFHHGAPDWIFLPDETVGVENTPFDTTVDLGALKTFNTNGSGRELEEDEFEFRLRAVEDGTPMPEGASEGIITAKNAADGKALFGQIKYDSEDVIERDPRTGAVTKSSKTFTYEVTEVLPDDLDADGKKDGVTYDTHTYVVAVTVAVSEDNDALNVTKVTVDGKEINPDNNVYFAGATNKYEAVGEWEPIIEKVLEGRDLEDQEFEFQIIDKDNNKIVASGKNDATGKVTMVPSKIEFTTADLANNGINNFVIHENYTKTDHDGMTTVAADIPVKITVSEKDEYDGTLNVVADPTSTISSPYTFTNVYEATGDWTPKAKKILTGALKLKAGDFQFELREGNTLLQTKPNKADGTVDFDKIEYTQKDVGTHTYTIKEKSGTLFGVEYDNTVYTIKVKVETVKGSDKLKVTATRDDAPFTMAQFENKYNPTPATAQPEYKKTVSGEIPSEDETFEFKLEKIETPDNGDFNYVKIGDDAFSTQTETLTLGKTIQTNSGVFDELTFLAEGTYMFRITETPGTNNHYQYDPKVYTYTVVVTGTGTPPNATLSAEGSYSYTTESGSEQTATLAAFTNKYTPTVANFTPEVRKVLKGEPTVNPKTFEFIMTPDAQNKTGGVFHGDNAFAADAADKEDSVSITIPAGGTGDKKPFKQITFKKAGTYLFHIEEVLPAPTVIDGIKYDKIHWTLTIVVEDQSGSLVITKKEAKQDEGGDLVSEIGLTTFTNEYTPTPETFAPPVKKVMKGEPLVANKVFTFTIKASSNPGGGAVINNDTTSITVPAGEADKVGWFEAITFNKAGTYEFVIKETTGNIAQIGYSTDVSYLTVVIKDTDPALVVDDFEFTEAATDDGSSAEFTNTYTPTPVDEVVPVEKTVPGEPLVKDKKFKFVLTPDKENKKGAVFIGDNAFEGTADDTVELTVPAGQTDANDVFKKLTFKKAGTYKFDVKEVIPPDSDKYEGITYDETVGTVTIVVKDADLKLEVESMTFEKAVNEAGTAALFTNPYCPKPVDYTPQVEKTVSGHPTVADKIFNFTLTPDPENKEDGVFISETPFAGEGAEDKTAVTVPAGEVNATADFSKLQFRKAGTYKFTVAELKEDEEGITYDEVVGTLTVTVTDADGHLEEEHVYEKAEETDAKYAKFDNDYTPEPVVEILHGYKVIDGEPQKDEEFTFKLESGGNTAQLPDGSYIPNPMPEEDEVTIYGDGEFEFGDMTYEWPGEYYYKISEAAGDAMGFTYDTAVWSVKVVVTDMDGYLETATTYTSDLDGAEAEELAKFTNTYTTGELKITKTVKGETGDKSKKFKFTVRLFDKNGDPLEGVYPITGDAEGEVVNGVGTVKLAHGEEAFVTEIPVDATWTVEEEDYAKYTAKRDNDHGTITVDKKSESNWINTAPDGPDTGDHNTVGGYLGLFGTSIMALAAMIFGRRRRRENEE